MTATTSINTVQAPAPGVFTIDPASAASWLARGEAVLIDVREPSEYSSEHIAEATLMPLSRFDPAQAVAPAGKKLILQCKGGTRARQAGERLVAAGRQEVWTIEGGLDGWKKAGLPTVRSAGGPRIDVQRQTQIVIGLGVLTGVLLGVFVSPWFLILSAFFGCGLTFAGLSGTCMLAVLIAKLPFNQKGAVAACGTCCSTKP
jgi:rhodanese-related sulfurtransferase